MSEKYSGKTYRCACPADLGEVEEVKLPQVGKTIKFLDANGNVMQSCEWNAEAQWFDWTK